MKLVIAILIICDNKEKQLKFKERYLNLSVISQVFDTRFLLHHPYTRRTEESLLSRVNLSNVTVEIFQCLSHLVIDF